MSLRHDSNSRRTAGHELPLPQRYYCRRFYWWNYRNVYNLQFRACDPARKISKILRDERPSCAGASDTRAQLYISSLALWTEQPQSRITKGVRNEWHCRWFFLFAAQRKVVKFRWDCSGNFVRNSVEKQNRHLADLPVTRYFLTAGLFLGNFCWGTFARNDQGRSHTAGSKLAKQH